MSEQGLMINDAIGLLQRAQEAVNRGDVGEMLLTLTESRYLDGLTRRLQEKWGRVLPWTEVDDCIAKAVDAACSAVFHGRAIRSLGAWLWKSADNIADDKWQSDYRPRVEFDEDNVSAAPDIGVTDGERQEREEVEELRRREAIRIARRLLPWIGEGQVVDVMELVIDAAADGLPDLPASSISEALGISKNAARLLVSRGMKRLRRLAEQEGVEIPTDLLETDTEDEKEDHDDA